MGSISILRVRKVAQRISQAKENLPQGVEPKMGAVSTGLGEVYMWTVAYPASRQQGAPIAEGKPGWQSDGSYLTPEGLKLRQDFELAMYLRTVQDWIIRPQLKGVNGVAEVDAIGGYEQQFRCSPIHKSSFRLVYPFADVIKALERSNTGIGAGYIERRGDPYVVRANARLESAQDIGNVVLTTKNGVPVFLKDVAEVGIGRELRTGSASEDGREAVVGTVMMLKAATAAPLPPPPMKK